LERITPVGSYPANTLDLFDMHGNVWEWCQDWYDPGYYQHSPIRDPESPQSSPENRRVLRGGSWGHYGQHLRAASRSMNEPGTRLNVLGLRVVLVFPA